MDEGKPLPLVIPDLDACPVCGVYVASRNVDGSRYKTGMARPECQQGNDSDGNLAYAFLTWTCTRCGARWRHGQSFEGVTT
jgi:hypothetical protein